jgi:hypothetical protein
VPKSVFAIGLADLEAARCFAGGGRLLDANEHDTASERVPTTLGR